MTVRASFSDGNREGFAVCDGSEIILEDQVTVDGVAESGTVS